MFQTIKLAKLRLSPINVRTLEDKALGIEPLAADINARGVLQNLLVTPVTKPRGTFDVIDGGRRLRALFQLAEAGTIDPESFDVPVMLLKVDNNALSETSLAANFHQLKLSPAEECRAFLHFLGTDGDIDAVATRFGQTRRFIEGRLRLATLAKPIFDALAKGDINLDQAKAYGCTENHEKQLRVFEQAGRYSSYNADAIRRMIVQDSMRSDDPIALLIGEDAYVSNGGRIERDLFNANSEDRWLDPEIAEKLAAAKLEDEAARLAAESGIAWIRPVGSENIWEAASKLHRLTLPIRPMTAEEQQSLAEIEDRCAAIETEMEDQTIADEAYTTLEAEFGALVEAQQELQDRPRELPEELKPHVGQFLKLSRKGEMVLDSDYYSEAPIRVHQPSDVAGADGNDARHDGHTGSRFTIGEPRGGHNDNKPLRPETEAPGGKAISARLFDELAVQRRDILAASLMAQPGLALDYLLFVMADAKRGYAAYGTTIKAPGPQDPQVGDIGPSQTRSTIADTREALDASWMEYESEVERFEAFRLLDDDAKAGWLAYTVAISLEAKPTYDARQNPLQNRLASILEIDVASCWRPTAPNYFDRVSKGSLLALLEDVGGPALSGRYAASKKGEIATACEKLFSGDAIVEEAIKDKALAWVPNAMLFLDGVPSATDDFGDDDDGSYDNERSQEGEGDDADPTCEENVEPEYEDAYADAALIDG